VLLAISQKKEKSGISELSNPELSIPALDILLRNRLKKSLATGFGAGVLEHRRSASVVAAGAKTSSESSDTPVCDLFSPTVGIWGVAHRGLAVRATRRGAHRRKNTLPAGLWRPEAAKDRQEVYLGTPKREKIKNSGLPILPTFTP
jgi:hypothetical protein